MVDDAQINRFQVNRPTGAGATLLAAAGLAAGFGAASCCAIPFLLGALGLGALGSPVLP
jgi:mercuric ion transport protein